MVIVEQVKQPLFPLVLWQDIYRNTPHLGCIIILNLFNNILRLSFYRWVGNNLGWPLSSSSRSPIKCLPLNPLTRRNKSHDDEHAPVLLDLFALLKVCSSSTEIGGNYNLPRRNNYLCELFLVLIVTPPVFMYLRDLWCKDRLKCLSRFDTFTDYQYRSLLNYCLELHCFFN